MDNEYFTQHKNQMKPFEIHLTNDVSIDQLDFESK